jgi:electron transfer flavoprotein alpha subunit
MGHHDAFVAPATSNGKNIAPRVAALLDVMQISDILSVESADTFTRPTYAGNAIATVKTSDAKLVITVRGTAFAKAAKDGGSGTHRSRILNRRTRAFQLCWRGDRQARTPRTDQRQDHRLGRSRAEGRPETFEQDIFPLADKLGAAVGAAALRSMRAMSPTTIRSARPARSSPPKSMSRSASRARSSTLPA